MARIKPQALLQLSKKKKSPSRITVTTIPLYAAILLLTLFFLYSTYSRRSSSRSKLLQTDVGESDFQGGGTSGDSKSNFPYAILSTTKGPISVKLFKDSSREIVQKFIDLSQKGHFKGMHFHRVIKHFILQAGDDDKPGAAEDWISSAKRHSQLISLEHDAFMLGTSKAKHDNKGFEIFITTAPIPDLNEKLIVFGRVIKGQNVVQEIEESDTDEHYRPISNIKISSVTLKEKI